jgi:hypothetical protein
MTLTGTIRKRESHLWEREEYEHYVEPEWTSKRLFEVEPFFGAVWDPCCGFGRIPEAAKASGFSVLASDIVDRGYRGCWPADFFICKESSTPNIVCNPPFDIAERFTKHALDLVTDKVAVIFPTARLNAARWLDELPLLKVWLLTPRPSMPPGHVIARGEKPGGGKMDFCWLVFRKGFVGAAHLSWLRRDK